MAICGDPELPRKHECVHVLSSFFPSIGALAPRDRDGLTSWAEYRFNMFRSFQFSAAHISRHKEPTCISFTTLGENIFKKKNIALKWIKVLAFGVFRRKLCP